MCALCKYNTDCMLHSHMFVSQPNEYMHVDVSIIDVRSTINIWSLFIHTKIAFFNCDRVYVCMFFYLYTVNDPQKRKKNERKNERTKTNSNESNYCLSNFIPC